MKNRLETKEFKFMMDEMDEEKGTFTGYASIFGVVDSYGDMVLPGAFKKTLREKKEFPMLWSHDVREPIGVIGGEEDEKGLKVSGQLNRDVQRGREIRSLMSQRAVNGLSIGFVTVKEGVDKDSQARTLKEINVWEISPCVFQACPDAEVIDVKNAWLAAYKAELETRLCADYGRLMAPEELKPYPNEHSARLMDPDKFDRFRRKADGKLYNTLKVPGTIDVIWGHLKDGEDDDWAAQALRFPTKDWTEAEAKAWLKDNKVKYTDFEPAKEPEKSTPSVKPETLHLMAETIGEMKRLVGIFN
jgi:HK97 family phage prohead protease